MASRSHDGRQARQARQPPTEILIGLMGETAVGKTSFARRVTGNPDIHPNHTLTQEGTGVMPYRFRLASKDGRQEYNVTLIDCPGFDSIDKPDDEIVSSIVEYLGVTASRQRLHGIVYVLDISRNRVTNTALANMAMFRKLVGDQYYENVVLGTTFWDSLKTVKEGADREADLKSEGSFWGRLHQKGSKVRRLGFALQHQRIPAFEMNALRPFGDDLDILLEICKNHEPRALSVQEEMASGLTRYETSAIVELNQWKQREQQHRTRKDQYRAYMQQTLAARGAQLGEQLRLALERMDQEYEREAEEFATDGERLQESRRRLQALIERRRQEQAGRPQPEPEANQPLRDELEIKRREREATQKKNARAARLKCSFYRRHRADSGVVRCKTLICKRCGNTISFGGKLFHCCFCKEGHDFHRYHHCEDCGNQCKHWERHGDMFEVQIQR